MRESFTSPNFVRKQVHGFGSEFDELAYVCRHWEQSVLTDLIEPLFYSMKVFKQVANVMVS